MSRAFVKEGDDVDALPDREASPHPNYVTPEGLKFIDAQVDRLSRQFAEARAAGERGRIANIGRDLRYWQQRRASAQVIEAQPDCSSVHFGSVVTIERDDGRVQDWRIVGEDEADPSTGAVSYVAPLARALMNKVVGDQIDCPSFSAIIRRIR
jgi:transcription elongation GreA/GreB family factor